ncbi:MAG: serine/threonine protein kinase [Myxococcales bacterium]|nr:serine/threonine protein kinase [Myxococcales bacterium]
MDAKNDIGGHATLPGEVLPTDRTIAVDGTMPGSAAALPEGPFRIGRFTAVRQLGSGAMGVVYMAYDEQLDRKVAIKLLQGRPQAGHASLGQARLLREAQAMAHVSHPNVAAVYDVGPFEDQVFVAMEFVEGKTLAGWLAERERPWREVVEMFAQAGRGLAAAHAAGLVHRDFKPENVLVGDDGRARVLDFGLARAHREVQTLPPLTASEIGASSSSLNLRLTQADSLVGTPAYMAPEQYMRAALDARSDQFSFCVALWEGLYGARPFGGQTLPEMMAAVTRGAPQVPRQHRPVPAFVHDALCRGLAVDPERRWPDMPTLLAALERDPTRRRRRIAWRIAGVAAVGAAALAGWRLQELATRACTGAAAELVGVWDDERRAAVATAIAATDVAYADDVATRVRAGLDAYAAAWVGAHTQACEATAIRREQSQELLDRRMTCLDERRAALRALVEVLARADPSVVESAVQAAGELPRLEPCADRAYLQARVRLPEDPDTARRVAAAREQVTAAHALYHAGKLAEAREIAADIEDHGYAPLQAEADLLRGELLLAASELQLAELRLREAYTAARAAGHDEVAAAAATRLIGVNGGLQAHFAVGAVWREVAGAEVTRTRLPLAEADLARETGNMASREGDYPRAEAELTRAVQLREQVVGAQHSSLIGPLDDLGKALERAGKYAEAERHLRRALALAEATLAPDHPLVADAADNLGEIAQTQGRYEEALAHHLRGLEIRERVYGRDNLRVTDSLTNLGIVAESLGRTSESEAYFRRTLALHEKLLGPDAPVTALTRANVGALLHIHGNDAESELLLRRALAAQESGLPPDHPERVFVLSNLALTMRARGQVQEAIDLLVRALHVTERSSGADHANAAGIRQNLGSMLVQLGRQDEALAEFERARQIREKALGPKHPDVAFVRVDSAEILVQQGKYAEAEPVLRESIKDLEAGLGLGHPDLAHPIVALVDLLLATRRADEALPLAERALALRQADEAASRELAAARFALAQALLATGGDRPRATQLARAALVGFSAASPERASVDRWLAKYERR